MIRLLRRGWILALLVIGGSLAFAASQDVAYVLQVSGPWTVRRQPARNLYPGHALQAGDTIALQRRPRSSDLLVVLGRDDNQIVARRRCAVDDCRSPVVLPDNLGSGETLFSRVIRAVMERWAGQGGSRFSSLETRGGPEVLYESVIAVGGVETELLPMVGDLSPGAYKLTWEPIAVEGRETPAAPPPLRLEVGPGRTTKVSPTALRPGLYAVQAFRATEEAGTPVADAWVLAVEDCSYPEAAKQFGEAVTVSGAWAAEVSGDTVRRFLRARLFDLASNPPPCPR